MAINLVFCIVLNLISAAVFLYIRPRYLRDESALPEKTESAPGFSLKHIPGSVWIGIAVFFAVNIAITVFVSLFYRHDMLLFDLQRIALASLLWPAAWIDWKAYKIPNVLILIGIVYWGIIVALELVTEVQNALWGMLLELIAAGLVGGVVFIAGLLSRNGVGFGDIKLLILLCLLLGMDGIWSALFLSLIIAFVAAIVLLATKRKKRKDLMAFAPAILLGVYLSIVLTGM